MASNPSWPWPNFAPKEIACKCCGETYVDNASMDALQRLRDEWGVPIRLTCGHRCENHNKAVGGAKASLHLKLAFDCACPEKWQRDFADAARRAGFRGIIRYPKRGFVHLDCRLRRHEKVES